MSSIDAQDDPIVPKAQRDRNKEVWVSVPEQGALLVFGFTRSVRLNAQEGTACRME